ncbi:MAG: hypothetical protein Q4A32_03305 [Lachnospiraceae bacterium]|nr:hypothetical protein [Lachnospiraceae bacterium]
MGKMSVTDFFQAVDRRFEKLGPEKGAAFQTVVGGKVIEQRFLTKANADCVASYLITPVLKEFRKPDAVFYYWTDDCCAYNPSDTKEAQGVFISNDGSGYLRVTAGREMLGTDYVRNCYYHCRQPVEETDYIIHGHSMAPVFGRWALRNDLMLLHSACVGLEGKGVMIAARAGGGKSTLAISCLLGGFDFVSDDYILLTGSGPLKAMPLYKVIGINQDMAAILKPDLPVMRIEPKRENKLYLDASEYAFHKEMSIDAIIYPNPCGIEEPMLVETNPGPVLAKLIDSSAKNIQTFRGPQIYRMMAERLMGLPVYEFRLSRDLIRNRDVFGNFLKKRRSRTE